MSLSVKWDISTAGKDGGGSAECDSDSVKKIGIKPQKCIDIVWKIVYSTFINIVYKEMAAEVF